MEGTRDESTGAQKSSSDGEPRAPRSSSKLQRRVGNVSRVAQYTSSAVFSIFLTWHMAATASGAFGESAATRTMLLGRDQWYQRTDFPSEPIVVFGAAAVHVAAGVVRGLAKPRKSQLSRHAMSGWLLVPVVAFHAWIHRLRPAKAGVSPSLLSYQYVVYALQRQPIVSWAAYGVLAVAGSYHALAGWRRILSRDKRPARLQTPVWRAGFAAVVSSLGLGLARLHAESPIPNWLAARYEPLL